MVAKTLFVIPAGKSHTSKLISLLHGRLYRHAEVDIIYYYRPGTPSLREEETLARLPGEREFLDIREPVLRSRLMSNHSAYEHIVLESLNFENIRFLGFGIPPEKFDVLITDDEVHRRYLFNVERKHGQDEARNRKLFAYPAELEQAFELPLNFVCNRKPFIDLIGDLRATAPTLVDTIIPFEAGHVPGFRQETRELGVIKVLVAPKPMDVFYYNLMAAGIEVMAQRSPEIKLVLYVPVLPGGGAHFGVEGSTSVLSCFERFNASKNVVVFPLATPVSPETYFNHILNCDVFLVPPRGGMGAVFRSLEYMQLPINLVPAKYTNFNMGTLAYLGVEVQEGDNLTLTREFLDSTYVTRANNKLAMLQKMLQAEVMLTQRYF